MKHLIMCLRPNGAYDETAGVMCSPLPTASHFVGNDRISHMTTTLHFRQTVKCRREGIEATSPCRIVGSGGSVSVFLGKTSEGILYLYWSRKTTEKFQLGRHKIKIQWNSYWSSSFLHRSLSILATHKLQTVREPTYFLLASWSGGYIYLQ